MSRKKLSTTDRFIPRDEHVSAASELGETFLIRVQNVASQQEELCQIREQVLINRERFSSSNKRVRHQRDVLGAAEAKLMDAFRELYNSPPDPDLSDLAIVYKAVEDARNKLVGLEDDCLHLQDALGAAEWELMDAETELYQYDLQQLAGGDMGQNTFDSIEKKIPTPVPPSTKIPPSTTPAPPTAKPSSTTVSPSLKVQYQVAIIQQERLLREFDHLRSDHGDMSQSMASDTDITMKLDEHSDEVIWNVIKSEVQVKSLKAELAPEDGPLGFQCCTKSDIGGITKDVSDRSATKISAFSEGAARHLSDHLNDKHLVAMWLLDCLRNSCMEKLQFENILTYQLQLLNVTTLNIRRSLDYVKTIWPLSMISLSRQPVLEKSVSVYTDLEQKEWDDMCEIVSPSKKDDVDPPMTSTRTRNFQPAGLKTEMDVQWFISPPRSALQSLKFDDAAILKYVAAWAEGDNTEAIPTHFQLPAFEQQVGENDFSFKSPMPKIRFPMREN
jgi:hypothetical protein